EKGVARYGDRGVNLYALQDVAASAQSLMLLCTELGLGTVWVGAFDEIKVQTILSLPKNLRPVTIIPVGYSAKTPDPTPRVSKDEAVVFIK
ncbi:MAG: nitroreductase family protein, partial [Planctomycetes bacterium]|nr:nitroreductase family protein [Planctomycetota bacterium]